MHQVFPCFIYFFSFLPDYKQASVFQLKQEAKGKGLGESQERPSGASFSDNRQITLPFLMFWLDILVPKRWYAFLFWMLFWTVDLGCQLSTRAERAQRCGWIGTDPVSLWTQILWKKSPVDSHNGGLDHGPKLGCRKWSERNTELLLFSMSAWTSFVSFLFPPSSFSKIDFFQAFRAW